MLEQSSLFDWEQDLEDRKELTDGLNYKALVIDHVEILGFHEIVNKDVWFLRRRYALWKGVTTAWQFDETREYLLELSLYVWV